MTDYYLRSSYASLQAAVTAAEGSTLLIDGAYTTESPATLPANGLRIIGHTPQSSSLKLANGSNNDLFFGSQVVMPVIENLTIDMNRANQSVNGVYGSGLHFDRCDGGYINNVVINNAIANAARIVGSKNWAIGTLRGDNNLINGVYTIRNTGTDTRCSNFTIGKLNFTNTSGGDALCMDEGTENGYVEYVFADGAICGITTGVVGTGPRPNNLHIESFNLRNCSGSAIGLLPCNDIRFGRGKVYHAGYGAGSTDEAQGCAVYIKLDDNNGGVTTPIQNIERISFGLLDIEEAYKHGVEINRTDGSANITDISFERLVVRKPGQIYAGSGSRYSGLKVGYGSNITVDSADLSDSSGKADYALDVATGTTGYVSGRLSDGVSGNYNLPSGNGDFAIIHRNASGNGVVRSVHQDWIGDDNHAAAFILHGTGPSFQFKDGLGWNGRLHGVSGSPYIQKEFWNGSAWTHTTTW